MNNKHRATLGAIFTVPVPVTIEWMRIERLFVAVGCRAIEGAGSRVRFDKEIDAIHHIATFHRPHPAKEAKAYQVRDARAYLEEIGVTP